MFDTGNPQVYFRVSTGLALGTGMGMDLFSKFYNSNYYTKINEKKLPMLCHVTWQHCVGGHRHLSLLST